MYRTLINALPIWQLIIFTMLTLILLTYLSAVIFSRWQTHANNKSHRDAVNAIINFLSGGIFILLAFVIVSSWNYYIKAQDVTSKEAACIGIILRNIDIFPTDFSKKMYAATANYAVAVRTTEWIAMRNGDYAPKAWDAIDNIYTTITSYTPTTSKEAIFYNNLIKDINNLLEARRERLNQINGIIPPILRNSLIIGSILLAILLGGLRGEKNLFSLILPFFFAGILGFNLALAQSFDYPYSGDISISNQVFYRGALSKIPDSIMATTGSSAASEPATTPRIISSH